MDTSTSDSELYHDPAQSSNQVAIPKASKNNELMIIPFTPNKFTIGNFA